MTQEVTKRGRAPVTRDAVHDSALTLFAERGYHGTSLRDIAELLSIRTPSLYNHMESKNELLQAIVLETLTDVIAATDRALAETTGSAWADQVAAYVTTYAHFHATHQRASLVVNQDTTHLDEPSRSQAQGMRRRHELQLRKLLESGSDAGEFQFESAKVVSFTIREMSVSLARWFKASGDLSAAEVATQYGQLALRMVGASR